MPQFDGFEEKVGLECEFALGTTASMDCLLCCNLMDRSKYC
jgi:hypothetical protein